LPEAKVGCHAEAFWLCDTVGQRSCRTVARDYYDAHNGIIHPRKMGEF
jgi:hypothetical protein